MLSYEKKKTIEEDTMKKIVFTAIITLSMVFTLYPSMTKGKGKMSGIVTEKETGAPLDGVTVKMYCTRANAFHSPSPKTDKEGKWAAFFIRAGNWNLDFEKNGYETKRISFYVDTTPGSKNPKIEVSMGKVEGPTVGESVIKQIDKAKVLMSEGQYDNALKSLAGVKEKYKEESGIEIVDLYMGNCYSKKGDYNKAIEHYTFALKKYPKHKELILSVGNAYNNVKDYDKAMEWFEKLGIEEIGNVDTLYNIGVIAYNKGDFANAEKYFKKAADINIEFADAFYQLGMTYTALDKQSEAVEVLKKFLEMAPDSPNADTAKAIIDAFKDAK